MNRRDVVQQALHILKKDVYYLWREISLVVVLCALLAFGLLGSGDPPFPARIIFVVAGFVIARLVLAETIPGDRQFWLTRPYDWRSLLAAKILFIIALIQVPIFMGRLIMLAVTGFPIASLLPGLLWSQFLITVAFAFPVAALTATNRNIAATIFSALSIFVVWQIILPLAWPAWLYPQFPAGVEWIRASILVIGIITIGLTVLLIQYKTRRTQFSRAFAAAAIVAVLLLTGSMPATLALNLQSMLNNDDFDETSVQLEIAPSLKPPSEVLWQHRVRVPFSFEFVLPADADVHMNTFIPTFEWPGGQTRRFDSVRVVQPRDQSEPVVGFVYLTRPEFDELPKEPATIHISVYFTVFGKPREKTITIQEEPVEVLEGLQCYAIHETRRFLCRSPFRWPKSLVVVNGESFRYQPYLPMSYSPFPAGMELVYVAYRGFLQPQALPDMNVTITLKEPLAHLHREFVLRDVRLADLAAFPK
ncbi:MAG: hypothetical protein HY646_12100 [Acidobacteria bacterium]|nr:hypothetical protein [Acidobacteriota bacterium]